MLVSGEQRKVIVQLGFFRGVLMTALRKSWRSVMSVTRSRHQGCYSNCLVEVPTCSAHVGRFSKPIFFQIENKRFEKFHLQETR